MNTSDNTQAPGQNKTSTIIVNGRPRTITGKSISYEEVVKLAFPDDPSNQEADYTVAYANLTTPNLAQIRDALFQINPNGAGSLGTVSVTDRKSVV